MDAKHAPTSPRAAQAVDPVRIRGRRYSPDERNEVSHYEQLYRYQANRPCRAVYRGLIRALLYPNPIFPAAPWLMYDPSGIVCLLAALAFGPKLGRRRRHPVLVAARLPRPVWRTHGHALHVLPHHPRSDYLRQVRQHPRGFHRGHGCLRRAIHHRSLRAQPGGDAAVHRRHHGAGSRHDPAHLATFQHP